MEYCPEVKIILGMKLDNDKPAGIPRWPSYTILRPYLHVTGAEDIFGPLVLSPQASARLWVRQSRGTGFDILVGPQKTPQDRVERIFILYLSDQETRGFLRWHWRCFRQQHSCTVIRNGQWFNQSSRVIAETSRTPYDFSKTWSHEGTLPSSTMPPNLLAANVSRLCLLFWLLWSRREE